MGNPRYRYGVAYQVGSCRTQGFSPRPQGYTCSVSGSVPSPFQDQPLTINSPVRKQNPVLLRQPGPLLLHGQRRQRAPGLRLRVRAGGADVHQEQAQQQRWRQRADDVAAAAAVHLDAHD